MARNHRLANHAHWQAGIQRDTAPNDDEAKAVKALRFCEDVKNGPKSQARKTRTLASGDTKGHGPDR